MGSSFHWVILPADCTSANAGFDLYGEEQNDERRLDMIADASDFIVDIREYDVPYHVRVAIDKGLGVEMVIMLCTMD